MTIVLMLGHGRLLILLSCIVVIVLPQLWLQGWFGGWDPVSGVITGERRCRPFPDEIEAWTVRGVPPDPEALRDLERWAGVDRERVNRAYGETCSTPLHEAAETGHPLAARILLTHGADSAARDEYGKTPLHLAAGRGYIEVAAALLEAGADPRTTDDAGKTPLHEAALGIQLQEQLEGKVAAARLLLDRGADPDAQERGSRWTALQYLMGRTGASPAESFAARAMAELLLERGAAVDLADAQGTRPLHRAAAAGDSALVASLLAAGADASAPDRFSTPLGSAASGGHPAVARLLLDHGADPRAGGPSSPLEWQGTPLEMAVGPGIRDTGAAEGRRAVAVLLVERGAEVDARNGAGRTLLHAVAEDGGLAWAELLLDQGADPSARDTAGVTPLHLAAENAHLAVAELLLAHGADPGAAARDASTPLERAAMDPEMEALLARHGAR